MAPKVKVKTKNKVKGKAKGKVKLRPVKTNLTKVGGGKQAGDTPGKEFPFENGPTPSKMEPREITRIYKLPDGKLKTEEDVIDANGYKMEEKLDAGGFGVIFFARHKKTKVRVACKVMEVGTDWSDSRVRDVKNELFVMEKVKHLYVVKLFTHFLTQCTSGNRLYIYMQLADGGNLAKFLQKRQAETNGNLSEQDAKLYFAQIVCGINHMHSIGICHRDIKLQNVLLVENSGSISGDYTMLMADFGLSRIIHHDGSDIALNRTICGTPIFMSPELLLRKSYNAFLADLWALGITIYVMVTLEIPVEFRDMRKAIQDLLDKKWSWPEDKMKTKPTENLKAMTAALLEPDPTRRLTMIQLCTHKWMAAEYKKAQAMANKK